MKGNKGKVPSKRVIHDVAVTSNQWQSDPRQQLFLSNYFDPRSETFSNIFRSALNAGYKESYARNLVRQDSKNMWLQEFLDKTTLLPEHINAGITQIATSPYSKASDKLKAYELLGKLQGLFIDKSMSVNVNIEQAINELK